MSILPFKRRKIPYVYLQASWYLLAANVIVFILGMFRSDLFQYLIPIAGLGFEPAWLWKIFTYSFVNSGIMSIVFTVIGFIFFAQQVERQMGSYSFLIFTLGVSAVTALATLLLSMVVPLGFFPLYGSSVMLFALLVAYAAFYPDAILHFFGIIPIRALILVLIYVGLIVISAFFDSVQYAVFQLLGFVIAWLWAWIQYKSNIFSSRYQR